MMRAIEYSVKSGHSGQLFRIAQFCRRMLFENRGAEWTPRPGDLESLGVKVKTRRGIWFMAVGSTGVLRVFPCSNALFLKCSEQPVL